ncbi:putative membrane protein [Kibdelosporangium banguiense]|uniref:Membrane protein n=1 Tax=Kibdelosporangium banguiense TaxID=1365924 RepID=A0ABS4TZJ7_9PSEU|nr:DUF2339 domain-containing protein [Kibdelosporangium banguiense]MBP2329830.1 putative membrane protein [Kibdelosporangium banguiense]
MHPLLRLADEVSELSRRLDQISIELRGYQPEELTRPIAEPAPAPPAPVMPAPVYPQEWMPAPRQKSSLFETLGKDGAGSRVLAWVGGAVTLLGVVLLLVLAVQRGWLGPLPRVLGGAALGGALIGIGLWVHRSPAGRTGALALAATGIAALYLDTIAATTLFDDMPRFVGLLLALVIALAGQLLAAKWNEIGLAIAVIIGCAVCAPMITDGFSPELVAFLLMVQAASVPVQLTRGWSAIPVAAGIPAIVASALGTSYQSFTGTDPMLNALLALMTTLTAAVLGLVSVRHKPDSDAGPILLAMAAIPALVSVVVLTKAQAVAVSGGVAGLMLVVWCARKWWPRRVEVIAGAATLVAGLQATAIAFDGSTRSAILMGEAVLLALVAMLARTKVAWWGGLGFGVLGGLLAVINDVPPSLLLLDPVQPETAALTAGLLASGLIVAISVLLPWANTPKSLVPWLLTGIAALYGAAGLVLCTALLIQPDRTGFLLGHVAITVSWTVAALVLLLRGIAVKPVRVVGLVLVGAAVVKLVLFDLAALDGLARVAAFLGAGLILLGAGTRYARLVARQSEQAPS